VFPKGVHFIYHESDYNGDRYWNALAQAVSVSSPAYGPALAALQARGGVVPLAHFSIISGSPLRQSGQIASDSVLQRLEAVKLVRRIEIEGVGPCVAVDANGRLGRPEFQRLHARLIAEKILLLAVRDWARRLGVASYDKIATREDDPLPRYGTFNWDLCGPSYIAPFVRHQRSGDRPKPGFLVCDALAGHSVNERALGAFVRKCKLSSGMRNLPPFLPVFIADGFTREAIRLGRSHGLIIATPHALFGRDVAVGLATLLETLTKAAAIAVAKPEVITELFDRLGQIEGAASNLRGVLFELLVGHATYAVDGGSIEIGVFVIDSDGFKAEIDVLRTKSHETWVYECKGYGPDHLVGIEDVKRWLEDRVPGIYRNLRHRYPNAEFYFEFWTTGNFTTEASAYLENAKARLRRYSIGYKAGTEVRKHVAKVHSASLIKTLDEHYFNHPISRFNKKYDGVPIPVDAEIDLDLQIGNLLEEPPAPQISFNLKEYSGANPAEITPLLPPPISGQQDSPKRKSPVSCVGSSKTK